MRGDFERIFGKIPETLRPFFTMLLAKPIAQICLVPFLQVKSRTFANAYKNRGICLKAHANGRNIVGQKIPTHCWMLHVTSVCTPCGMLLPVVGSCCTKV